VHVFFDAKNTSTTRLHRTPRVYCSPLPWFFLWLYSLHKQTKSSKVQSSRDIWVYRSKCMRGQYSQDASSRHIRWSVTVRGVVVRCDFGIIKSRGEQSRHVLPSWYILINIWNDYETRWSSCDDENSLQGIHDNFLNRSPFLPPLSRGMLWKHRPELKLIEERKISTFNQYWFCLFTWWGLDQSDCYFDRSSSVSKW
jgi:hypothetical protein